MSPPPAGNIKGVSFVSARRFVEQLSPDAWARVVSALPAADRATASSTVAVGWYPVALYAQVLVAIDATLGSGDLTMIARLGRFSAEHDLTAFYRFILRFWSPVIVIEKTAELWGRYYDTGTWKMERGDRRVSASLTEWAGAGPAPCAATQAYVTRLFELVGAAYPRVEHPTCLARGGASCTFVITWR